MAYNKKKLLTWILSGAVVLSAGSFIGYSAYANSLSKQEILNQKKADFDKQKAELLANPNANSEQGKRVKDLGTEVGQLEKELRPEKPEDLLKRKLYAYKEMIMIHEAFYRDNADVDLKDPKVVKVLNEIKQKKQLVERIEKEVADKIKSSEQILKEFEQGKAELRN